MKDTIRKYLDARAVHGRWPLLSSHREEDFDAIVVIPALAESALLFQTLTSLAASTPDVLQKTLVLIVVNNRSEAVVDDGEAADNQRTLHHLSACDREGRYAPMHLAWVDAASPGATLPDHEGVGLARKIGLDHGLALLAVCGKCDAPLICVDADAPPDPGYLETLLAFYGAGGRWAGFAAYEHDLEGDREDRESVIAYETYMRYHELNLRWAGSPYAFPALGSIISCTAAAYAAAGGMNRRCAGEDFYYMQQLAKTGAMTLISGALVRPSGRRSNRTPFGTGRRIASPEAALKLYHPESYRVLKDWLALIGECGGSHASILLDRARAMEPELAVFLEKRGFARVWENLRLQHRLTDRLQRHFHLWFDGLRTIQLIHHLRDSRYADLPAREALAVLPGRVGCLDFGRDRDSREILEALRRACSA